jgi:hypothetical protein
MVWISQGGRLVISNRSLLEAAYCTCRKETNRVGSMAGVDSEYAWIVPGLNGQHWESQSQQQSARVGFYWKYPPSCLVRLGLMPEHGRWL